MKVVFGGACITSGTGKIGGTVIQGGPYGAIARVNFKPKNRDTNNQYQPCEKEAFTSVAKLWRSLTVGQVAAWNAFAIAPANGYTTFLKYNLQFFRINGTINISPPTLPVAPASIILMGAGLLSTTTFNLKANYTASTNPNWLQVFVSINNSPGATKLVKSTLRLIASLAPTAGIFNYTIPAVLYGVAPVSPSSNFIGVRCFDRVTGYLTPIVTIQFNI
jgi:hypothetical protein